MAKFKVGDKVRVKYGVTDVDYPDMPLGGWTGTIDQIQGSDTFSILWSKETMEAIHPVFIKRCEIDGLDPEEYVLTGDDLETDPGGPLDIEQPTKITTRPLSPKDEDDRIMIFELTSNDPLPEVDDKTLDVYHAHLSKTLVFPFAAEYTSETGPFLNTSIPVEIMGLGRSDDESMIDDLYGILCEARHEGRMMTLPLGDLEVEKGGPIQQLIEDYSYWFWGCG